TQGSPCLVFMRKKIEITTDESRDAEAATPPASEDIAPEFDDHINPPEESKAGNGKAQDGPAAAEPATAKDSTAEAALLQAQLEEAQRKVKEAENQLLYTQAEFQNFRRRKEEE